MSALPAAALLLLSQAATEPAPAAPALTTIVPACPANPSPADIIVCGRRGGDGFRLPAPNRFDPAGNVDSVSRERHRLLDIGAAGIGSCSTVGPGGWTGCMLEDWREADEQYAGRNHGHGPGPSVQVAPFLRARPH
ncbi:MAG: hypothetical protein JO276_01085 [Sphingomonadaceae bacterium]|nr:hypothetical protein [Sphingomonadaceae bacterium]